MKRLLILLSLLITLQTYGQINKKRPIIWVIPSLDTRINGVAVGFMINSLKETDSVLTTEINGLNIEIIGVGLLLLLAPSDPIYHKSDSAYFDNSYVDTIINSYNSAKYKVNGISISLAGTVGHDININGINLSGLNTLTGKTNGLSTSILINMNGVVNGVSVAVLLNKTIQTKGLQIGLFNQTKRLRGFQIGLWNKNEKRSLPFINWNFN